MPIYTSRISYKGDIKKIDITAKSATGIGVHFKPTWNMVMEYKRTGDKEKYTKLYLDILEDNYYYIRQLIDYLQANDIVLVCYCRSGEFCHRVILAEYLNKLSKIEYLGEI